MLLDGTIYDTIKIYRTKNNDNIYYWIGTTVSDIFIDTTVDNLLHIAYTNSDYLSISIIQYTLNKYNFVYNYKFTYYNTITEIESDFIDVLTVNLINPIGSDNYVNLSTDRINIIYDLNFNSIRIYRTKVNQSDYYYLDTFIYLESSNPKEQDFLYKDSIIDDNLTQLCTKMTK